jgi:putative ABC transport system permease protein
MSESTARDEATREFGNIDFTKRYCREQDQAGERAMRWSEWSDEVRQNIGYAVRTLRRNPGYATVAVLTMLIGIGANSAIFTVTDAVMLRPFPYADPGRLVIIYENKIPQHSLRSQMSPADVADYRSGQQSMTAMGAFAFTGLAFQPRDGTPVTVEAMRLGANVFDILGVRPALGRTFLPGEDSRDRQYVVVVSDGFWRRQLGADAGIVGRTITFDDRPYTIIGVMPPGFSLGYSEQVWIPLDVSRILADPNRARKLHFMYGIGRLKPGVSLEAAHADLMSISRRLEKQYPDANTGHLITMVDLRSAMVGDLRPTMILLTSAAALVLLIACANLANIIVARGMARRRELAVRAALGAGRARLTRQLLTETIILALIGAAGAVLVAAWGTKALLALNPETLPPYARVALDGRVLLFAGVAAGISGLLAGILPSFAVTRVDLNETLKESSRANAGGLRGDRVRRGLVIGQTALAVVLLIGSGILIRSLRAIQRIDMGFNPDGVLTADVTIHGAQYDSVTAVNAFFVRAMEGMRASPSIVAAGAVGGLPLRGSSNASLTVEGTPVPNGHLPEVGYVSTAGDYFKTLGIPLLRGRMFSSSDGPKQPSVVVINNALAKQFFASVDPVGRRIRLGPNPNDPWSTIIGVVGDVRQQGLEKEIKPTAFVSNQQDGWTSLTFVVRASRGAMTALPAFRDAIRATDPTAVIDNVQPMDVVVGASLSRRTFSMALLTIFAAVALGLAALGVYGVLSYAVAARRREFGVRLALGAEVHQVVTLVLRQGLGWTAAGVTLGVIGARAGTRLLEGQVFGIAPTDPTTYAVVAVVVAGAALLACVIPVRRATHVDPAMALRDD